MALNAIKSPLVQYDDGVTVVVNGTPVTVGSGDAYYITTTLAKEQRISDQRLSNTNEYTVEFGERYFPDLRLSRDDDAFDRPSHTWTYKTEEIGSYVDYDKLVETYTTGVTGRDLYDLPALEHPVIHVVEKGIRECPHISLAAVIIFHRELRPARYHEQLPSMNYERLRPRIRKQFSPGKIQKTCILCHCSRNLRSHPIPGRIQPPYNKPGTHVPVRIVKICHLIPFCRQSYGGFGEMQ